MSFSGLCCRSATPADTAMEFMQRLVTWRGSTCSGGRRAGQEAERRKATGDVWRRWGPACEARHRSERDELRYKSRVPKAPDKAEFGSDVWKHFNRNSRSRIGFSRVSIRCRRPLGMLHLLARRLNRCDLSHPRWVSVQSASRFEVILRPVGIAWFLVEYAF
jgi:hypothetical protein